MPNRQPHILLDPANFWLSLLTFLLVGVAGSLAAQLFSTPGEGKIWAYLTVVLALVGVLGFLLSASVQRWLRRNRGFIRLNIHRPVIRAKALIVFVSKGAGSSSALDAALYHAEEDVLKELWIITSEEASDDAARVRQEVARLYPKVTVHPPVCVTSIHDIQEAKTEVENIRRKCLQKYQSERDVICDFTGLTKHMSAGMIFACAPREARLQYMHPRRVLPADGRADPAGAASEPMEVEIAYQVEPDS